jgi:uncharacterized membrane protein YfcA
MTAFEVAAIGAAGFVAGVVNALAGGGALLTVPLLVMIGLPGTVANGTNRVAVLAQSVVAAIRFRAEGVSGFSRSLPVVVPLLLGGTIGAYTVAHLDDETFERAFGVVMLVLLVPALRTPRRTEHAGGGTGMHPILHALMFFVIGLYGGSFQAGVGLFMLLALARTGHDLVMANSIKAVTIAAYAAVAVAIFVHAGQVVWGPALLLSLTTSAGAAVGTRVAVRGGDRVIRPVMALAIVALAGKMLRLY